MSLYEPLYSRSRGLAGFSCLVPVMMDLGGPEKEPGAACGKLCLTERGMLAHLESKHGVVPQQGLPLPAPQPEKS